MNRLEKKFLLWELKILLRKASTMKLSWTLVFQALATAAHGANAVGAIVPAGKPQIYFALVVGILQLLVHWRQAYFNPDGTPASVAYIAPTKNNFGGPTMKMFCLVCLIVLALAVAAPLQAQTGSAPAALPGYQVSLAAGYSLLTGAQNNNGFFSSVAVPLRTWNATYSFNIAGRGDYFSIVTPSTYVVTAGPEFRFQFSRASFFNGKVFQPFINAGGGVAKSAAGGSGSYAAFKAGAGLDLVQTSSLTWRLAEVDVIHSKIFPNNYTVLSNWAELETGLKINF